MALESILAHTRADVAVRRRQKPLESFRQTLVHSDRSLFDALSKPGLRYILECKKASPSRGLIRPDFDPSTLAVQYGPYADAISVLTNERFFQGRHEYLTVVRDAVPLPVLCKDFVIDPYQVYEARFHGADAILLMLSVLDDQSYRSCAAAASELGLDVLTEVHDEGEVRRALELDAPIIGINNRNLATLEVDLATTERLAPLVPPSRLVLSESGLADHNDVLRLGGHADGFLVGTTLMAQPDVGRASRELIFGRVKVCGLTRHEDAQAAAQAGATYGGLIFAPASPRRVSEGRAAELVRCTPLDWVGVWVDEEIDEVARLARELGLAAVQLHGDEGLEYVDQLRSVLPKGCEVWKALRVRDEIRPLQLTGADRLLLDSWSSAAHGGTGRTFDWSLLEGRDLSNVVLGGGLNRENVEEAQRHGPFALDVNSGVEDEPGVKSGQGIAEFFALLRGAARSE